MGGHRSGGNHRAGRRTAGTSTTTTGSHRAVGRAARRRVAAWPVACVVLIGLLVAGWFGWNWADGVMESRAAAQATDCPEGDAVVRVAAAPALAEPTTTAASRWNRHRTVVRDHCVRIHVHTADDADVFAVLTGTADAAGLGGAPSAWLPASEDWADRLAERRPDRLGSSPVPVASGDGGAHPYVGLAGETVEAVHQHAAQSFRAFLLRPAQQDTFVAAGFAPAAQRPDR
ncbi:substrate-binding domain-containing protein [Saccharomonospora saliphila]|uniref:substrate-binding domain-containing protein n=1 Tax=Saccharomonospora saliphila TaxID=369829 RepID=UPI00036609D5|nr:substrate-binding domain-containing protein [Saccharomonospora saliphila]